MLVAIENIVNESVDDGRFSYSLVAQKNYFVLEQWRDASLAEVQVTYICHAKMILKFKLYNYFQFLFSALLLN